MDTFWWVLMLICTAPIWLPCLAFFIVGLPNLVALPLERLELPRATPLPRWRCVARHPREAWEAGCE